MWKENGNQNIAYQINGQGPAVMLIHGFPENSHVWEHQEAFLKAHFQVIIPDLPGSGKAPLTTPLTMDSMADYVHTILLAENIQEVVMIGHSMGGYVALAFAEKYPHMLKGLGLFHSTASADSEEKKIGRQKSIKMMQQYGSETFLRQTLPSMFSPAFKNTQQELVETYINMGLQCKQQTLIAYYEAMMQRPDRKAVLQNLQVPVLFVIGKDDNAIPIESVIPQVSLPAISSIYIFEKVGHMGMWEVFEESNTVLEQFSNFCQL
jgi:pimeloyl-ACP methyl ester carboxylesterase